MLASTGLMLFGAVAIVAGVLVRRWTARHDLKDAAIDSAWTLLRGRRTVENPTAIEAKLQDIQAQSTLAGKATRTAGTALAHVLAQAMGVVSLVLILAGIALAVAGVLWRWS